MNHISNLIAFTVLINLVACQAPSLSKGPGALKSVVTRTKVVPVTPETRWPCPANTGSDSGTKMLARVNSFRTAGSGWSASMSLTPNRLPDRERDIDNGKLYDTTFQPENSAVTLSGTQNSEIFAGLLKTGVVFDANIKGGLIVRLTAVGTADGPTQIRCTHFQRKRDLCFRFVSVTAAGSPIALEVAPHYLASDFGSAADYKTIAKLGGMKDTEVEKQLYKWNNWWKIVVNGHNQKVYVVAPFTGGETGDGGVAMESLSSKDRAAEFAEADGSVASSKTSAPRRGGAEWLSIETHPIGNVPMHQRK